jgi:hypothetical protein
MAQEATVGRQDALRASEGPRRSKYGVRMDAAGKAEQWSDGWARRGIRVALADDEEVRHCAHCDRYNDDDPLAHPSCLIVKKRGAPSPGPSRPGWGSRRGLMEEVTIPRSALEMLLATGRAVFATVQEQQMALQRAIVLAEKALEPPSEPAEAGGEQG